MAYWDKASFLHQLERNHNQEEVAIVKRMMRKLEERGLLEWAPRHRESKDSSFITSSPRRIIQYWSQGNGTGGIEFAFQHFGTYMFNSPDKRQEILTRLDQIGVEPHVTAQPLSIEHRRQIKVSSLADEKKMDKFVELVSWIAEEMKRGA